MERKRIYLCLAHMSEEGLEQKYIKEAFDTNWVVSLGLNVIGVSESIFKVGMCLPAGPYVSDEDVKYIVESIKANIL